MTGDVVALGRPPLDAPRPAFEQAIDHETVFAAHAFEAVAAARGPLLEVAQVAVMALA